MGNDLTLEKLEINKRLLDVEKHMAADKEFKEHLKKSIDEFSANIKAQNGRVSSLERWKEGINGRIAGAGAAGGIFGWIISILIKH